MHGLKNYCSLSTFGLSSIFTEIYLYSITPSNIEDPVLRQLQAELIAKNEAHAAEEEKRRLLFRIVAVGVSCKCYFFIASLIFIASLSPKYHNVNLIV